jgi:hypothetical protein
VLSTPNQWGLGEVAPFHVRDYSRESLLQALDPLFEVRALYNQNSGTPGRLENRGRLREIVPTTAENHHWAECFIAVATRRERL